MPAYARRGHESSGDRGREGVRGLFGGTQPGLALRCPGWVL